VFYFNQAENGPSSGVGAGGGGGGGCKGCELERGTGAGTRVFLQGVRDDLHRYPGLLLYFLQAVIRGLFGEERADSSVELGAERWESGVGLLAIGKVLITLGLLVRLGWHRSTLVKCRGPSQAHMGIYIQP